jgi:hypothetical protein
MVLDIPLCSRVLHSVWAPVTTRDPFESQSDVRRVEVLLPPSLRQMGLLSFQRYLQCKLFSQTVTTLSIRGRLCACANIAWATKLNKGPLWTRAPRNSAEGRVEATHLQVPARSHGRAARWYSARNCVDSCFGAPSGVLSLAEHAMECRRAQCAGQPSGGAEEVGTCVRTTTRSPSRGSDRC